ncbi:MAG: hypothetical protein HY799_08500 [Nitrosomonadales bacterium]|nr:hypothetical protein [Nitrosomonadales bacterium]
MTRIHLGRLTAFARLLFPSCGQNRKSEKIPLPFQGIWVDNARQKLTKSKPIEK